ncbi:protein FAR1-RELATED SEQUENCE 5-like [Lactuca sativa]|nr:protein FAR1-RELATED SEQUENCE 5-like [Lactuca sativa]
MVEIEEVDQPRETHVIDDNEANGMVECDEGKGIDESIVGMVFDTPDDAYTFYNDYAFLHGFGIRIDTTFKHKTTKEPYRKIYVCDKEGFKWLDDNASSGIEKKRRRDVRTGCKAELRISKMKDGKWFVDSFKDTHNHDLSMTPTKVMKHRSHGKFHRTMECKSLIVQLGQAGLRPCHVKKAINGMKTSTVADITSKQCADVLSEQRKQYRGKEFYGLIKHFQDKALLDNDQYFYVDLCDDGSPKNIFWADGRSRDAYTKFSDVVVFDVTYMTNKFKMPFAPFVGVNHHGQSILFGGALLENEKEETFEWLFEHFLKCMFGKYPKAIITDQDKAMGNAIKKVFPNTRHRFCAWHIKKHEQEHIKPYVSRYSDFKESYTKWVNSDTIEAFETRWEVIRDKHRLEKNCWISDMYNQRIHWAKAFLKDVFLAGMTTSGRSESINSFFDGFVNSNTMLNEFVVQYEKAVESRRAAEEDEDFKTMNSRPILSSLHPIEEKAGECYTRKIFDMFKKEWTEASSNLTHETISKSTEEIKYRVGQLKVDKTYWRYVTFRFSNEVNVTCSCSKYETDRILCKHSLYVMKKRHVDTLPSRYILHRWTLNARYKVGNGRIGLEEMNNGNDVSALTLWCVRSNFTKLIEQARDSPSEIEKVNKILISLLHDQENRKKSITVENTSQVSCAGISQVDMMPQLSIRDPLGPTNTKGRPKTASRIKSFLEAPKKRTCSYCQGLGHYATSCSKRKADESVQEKH